MTEGAGRLLTPLGVALGLLLFAAAYYLAYRWWRQRPTRHPVHLEVAALGLLALLTGGFFWRALTETGVLMPAGGGDLVSLYYPGYTYAAAQIKAGTIPLWNPHLYTGMPFAADVQMGLFYPLNWPLFLLYNLDYGRLEWLLILHYWLASAFTYLFLRDIGLRRLGALAGGVIFAFCGFMTAHLGHMPMVLVAAWLPLELLLLRRALLTGGRKGWAWSIAAGLSMAMALLAGHVQIFAYGLMAAGLLWLYLFFEAGHTSLRTAWPMLLKGGLALGVALGVSAVQLLPSIELSNYSVRSAVSYEEASEFPAQPVTLLNLFLPRVYGSSPTTYAFGIWQTTENWGYSGVVAMALAAAGLGIRRARMVGFFALLLLLALLLMVGDLSIVGGWVYKFLPGFSKLRDAGRALELFGFGLAGLAGFGLDALVAGLRTGERERRNILWWLVGLLSALVVVAVGILPTFYRDLLVNQFSQKRLPEAINDLGMLLIWLGALAGVVLAAYTRRMRPLVAGGAMLLLTALDLFSPNARFNPTTQDILAGYKNFDTISFLSKSTQNDATNLPQRIDSDTDVREIWQPSTALLAGALREPLYDTGGVFNPLTLDRYNFLWGDAMSHQDTPLYDLFGASFQVVSSTTATTSTLHAGQPKWSLVERQGMFDIWKNANALPRVFLVHEARIETDPEDISIIIWRQDIDSRHTVILGDGEPVSSRIPGTAENQPEGRRAGETVRVTRYTPNAVDISVKAEAPGWVVLTDAWFPGWRATVDGQPAAVVPADYAFRAVKVEAGEHTISMQFRPDSWVWGRLLSLATLAASVAGLAWMALVRRKAQPIA